MRYRLVKPIWGIKTINDNPNPKFVREVPGPRTYEGEDFSEDFLKRQNSLGYNIYYFPNSTSKKIDQYSMSGRDVDTFEWVFVDMDLKDEKYSSKEAFLERIKIFPLQPTFVVDSGNGIHVYWRIRNIDGDPAVFMMLQKALIRELQTDVSVWTPLQLMRCPGFKNTKKPDKNEWKDAVRLQDWETGSEYSVEEFSSILSEPSEKDLSDIQLHLDKLNGVITVQIQESLHEGLPKKFEKILQTEPYVRRLFESPLEAKGDRSSADMALANFLISKADFDRDETLQVLVHTQKALSREGRSRYDYAVHTLEKACRDCTPLAVANAEELLANPEARDNLGALVNGPYFLDALHKKWRKKQLLGLIAGAGVGKTSLSLKIFKEFIKNNEDNDDIFFFFSLEMTAGEILDRWKTLVGEESKFVQRLFVIGPNQFEDFGEDFSPNLQSIYRIVRDTCRRKGKRPGVVCIDHLDALEGDVDLLIKPNFGAETSKYVERRLGRSRVILNKDGICQKLKALAQMLDCFLIIQSQTTKDKDGGGDKPIGKNAAFGTSKFEWFCDYVVGVWRPLARMMDKCREAGLFVTAFQYAKIREQKPDKDDIQMLDAKMIKFNPQTEDFEGMTDRDVLNFHEILESAIKLREVQEKNKMKKYSKAPIQRLRELVNKSKE